MFRFSSMNKTNAFLICALIAAPFGTARAATPKQPEVYDITTGKGVPIAAKKTALPLVVYGEGDGKMATFVPSGYMGDASALKMTSTDFSAPTGSTDSRKQGETCLKIQYSTKGPAGWAGIFWMTPANNWGKIKGAGYDLSQAKKLTFWMRGEKGGERIAAIKFGGIVGPYPDTDSGSLENIKLKNEWTQYTIDLTGKDLRHIVGGFVFSVTRADNPRGCIFFLDEIKFEGDAPASTADAVPAAPASAPADATTAGAAQ
jgi:hypothetical protein